MRRVLSRTTRRHLTSGLASTLDRVVLKNAVFHATHGHLDEEKLLHQRFEVEKGMSGAALGGAAEAARVEAAELGVFGGTALDPGPPAAEGAWLEVAAHEGADLVFLEPELHLDGLEGRAVLPRHANEAVEVVGREVGNVHNAKRTTHVPRGFKRRSARS